MLQKLQEEKRLDQEKIFSLEKVNTNLEMARNKFVQLHTDEKNEKNEIREKLDILQEKYHTDIQAYMRKYHLVIGIAVVCLTILVVLNTSTLLTLFGLDS